MPKCNGVGLKNNPDLQKAPFLTKYASRIDISINKEEPYNL